MEQDFASLQQVELPTCHGPPRAWALFFASSPRPSLLVEHDLFRKPVPTFPDHALDRGSSFSAAAGRSGLQFLGSKRSWQVIGTDRQERLAWPRSLPVYASTTDPFPLPLVDGRELPAATSQTPEIVV